MFFRSKKINHSAKKIDKLVTGLIIGSAIFGLSQTKKWKEITSQIQQGIQSQITPEVKKVWGRALGIFGKTLAKVVGIFSKK